VIFIFGYLFFFISNLVDAMGCTSSCAKIVNFDDKEATVEALTRVLTNEPLRQRLRDEGIERTQSLSFDRLTHERMERILQIAF
jgi:glycosyltransferase involved in cell wall biosynthesis